MDVDLELDRIGVLRLTATGRTEPVGEAPGPFVRHLAGAREPHPGRRLQSVPEQGDRQARRQGQLVPTMTDPCAPAPRPEP